MGKIKGVIFDMDGLIFDTEMLYYQASQRVADRLGFPYDKELYLQFLGVSDEELWAAYHEIYQEFGQKQVQQFIEEAYAETLRMIDAGKAQLKPGVLELVAYLDQQQIPKIIASSNQRQVIDRLLASADLAEVFPAIVSVEDVERAKPDPAIFELARERLGSSKAETLVLEDSQNGILAAEAAGIPVVMIPDLLEPSPELAKKTLRILDSLHLVPEVIGK